MIEIHTTYNRSTNTRKINSAWSSKDMFTREQAEAMGALKTKRTIRRVIKNSVER